MTGSIPDDVFLSTPSARRATRSWSGRGTAQRDFYPRPPRGGRRNEPLKRGILALFLSTPSARRATTKTAASSTNGNVFLSTPSARRATSPGISWPCSMSFLSTPSARRATDFYRNAAQIKRISIHALREEGDARPRRTPSAEAYFYPRPPRGGRRITRDTKIPLVEFLSTPSARRATPSKAGTADRRAYFYPRPPRGGRPRPVPVDGGHLQRFLSTPSARRATMDKIELAGFTAISIHALREEGDQRMSRSISHPANFYPRPPRGGRQIGLYPGHGGSVFLSTPSARRATSTAPPPPSR